MEEVEIERDVFSEWTVDSDDELHDNDTKSKKSLGTQKMQSEWTKSQQQQESPELFRHNARMRMSSNQKKFSLSPSENNYMRSSRSVSPNKKSPSTKKSMLIVHTIEEANATANYNYVDPNSQ